MQFKHSLSIDVDGICSSLGGVAESFRLAFHLAEKASQYMQVRLRPSVALDGSSEEVMVYTGIETYEQPMTVGRL